RNPLIARFDIGRGQTRAVVEQYIGAQLERIGLPVGRDFPRLRQIADHLWVIGRVELEERRIMRRYRMQKREGRVAMTIVVTGFDRRGKFQDAAAFRDNLCKRRFASEYQGS